GHERKLIRNREPVSILRSDSFCLLHSLTELKTAIAKSNTLTEQQKLDISVDIESIKDQLVKTKPDKTIIGHLWTGLEKAAAVAGVIEAIERVQPFMQSL